MQSIGKTIAYFLTTLVTLAAIFLDYKYYLIINGQLNNTNEVWAVIAPGLAPTLTVVSVICILALIITHFLNKKKS